MYQKNEMRVTICNVKRSQSKSYIVSIKVQIILNRFVENDIVKTCCVISSYIYSSEGNCVLCHDNTLGALDSKDLVFCLSTLTHVMRLNTEYMSTANSRKI